MKSLLVALELTLEMKIPPPLLGSSPRPKLQALVYGILPPTIAIVDYAIGLKKLSANKQFLDVQTAVSL